MRKILFSASLVLLLIIAGTIAAVLYANGYRLTFGGGTGNVKFIEGTGLLVATSKPDGGRVYINNNLITATNNTINLAPDEYDVRIEKDGYVAWNKKITIKKGLVSEANALLFPTTPKLEAVTTAGISNLVMDATQTVLAFTVASSSASKNGIYSLDMSARQLIFLGETGTQLVGDSNNIFSDAKLSFSPNSKEILVETSLGEFYLLDAKTRNQVAQNVTNSFLVVERDWAQQAIERDKKLMNSLPRKLVPQAQKFFKNMVPSPDSDKILYEASNSGQLAQIVTPPAPSVNSTPDKRSLTRSKIYVYDIKEDKNYEIGNSQTRYLWHADGRHLVYASEGKINIVEFDGGNLTTIYDGPFLGNLVFPWPDGTSIGIISRLSTSVPYNLYRIGLQ